PQPAVKARGEVGEPATDGYRPGRATSFEVLEALQQLYPPQTTPAQIRRNRLTAYVQLYKALGGGWNLTDTQWTGQSEKNGAAAERPQSETNGAAAERPQSETNGAAAERPQSETNGAAAEGRRP